MRLPATAITVILPLLYVVCLSHAQSPDQDYRHPVTSNSRAESASKVQKGERQEPPADRTLSQDDRLSIMAAALRYRDADSEDGLTSGRDCSHLVHAIYEQAGLPYRYAPSSEIYSGAAGFERVKQPKPGDLVVWRGHVGIVTKPSQHIFFSFMSSGPATDDYQSPYWKGRGRPRFYRYVKDSLCAQCEPERPQSRLVKIRK